MNPVIEWLAAQTDADGNPTGHYTAYQRTATRDPSNGNRLSSTSETSFPVSGRIWPQDSRERQLVPEQIRAKQTMNFLTENPMYVAGSSPGSSRQSDQVAYQGFRWDVYSGDDRPDHPLLPQRKYLLVKVDP